MEFQTATPKAAYLPVAALGWSLGVFFASALIFAPLFNLLAARSA
jgi:hypothetical protein